MITLQFEEALVNQIASMTELEKLSLFEKINPLLRKEKQEHIVVDHNEKELIDQISSLEDDLEQAERDKDEAIENFEQLKDELRDAIKLPLSDCYAKLQEIINEL